MNEGRPEYEAGALNHHITLCLYACMYTYVSVHVCVMYVCACIMYVCMCVHVLCMGICMYIYAVM